MWVANFNQIYRENPRKQPFDCWVLLLCHRSGTKKESLIRSKHEQIITILMDQNVNYTEITSRHGMQQAYQKFNFENGKHPLFLVLNKHPLDYIKNDPLMVIEWGKWADIEELKDDLIAFVNFFSNEDFRKKIAEAKDPKSLKLIVQFFNRHGFSILSIGSTVAAALI